MNYAFGTQQCSDILRCSIILAIIYIILVFIKYEDINNLTLVLIVNYVKLKIRSLNLSRTKLLPIDQLELLIYTVLYINYNLRKKHSQLWPL